MRPGFVPLEKRTKLPKIMLKSWFLLANTVETGLPRRYMGCKYASHSITLNVYKNIANFGKISVESTNTRWKWPHCLVMDGVLIFEYRI
jgi:hypothetical protein